MNRIFACLILWINISSLAFADISKEKLPIPRFVTIKFDEVNVRTGPVIDCPIEWVFIRKGEPVEIIAEYEQWRKVRDINGEGGWVHASDWCQVVCKTYKGWIVKKLLWGIYPDE